MTLKISLSQHRLLVLVLFCKTVRHGILGGCYYSSLVYDDICYRKSTTLTYGKQLMSATKDMVQACSNHVHEKLVDRNDAEHDSWIVPVQSSSVHCVESKMVSTFFGTRSWGWSEGEIVQNNIDVYQTSSPDGSADFQCLQILRTQALQNVKVRKELH